MGSIVSGARYLGLGLVQEASERTYKAFTTPWGGRQGPRTRLILLVGAVRIGEKLGSWFLEGGQLRPRVVMILLL